MIRTKMSALLFTAVVTVLYVATPDRAFAQINTYTLSGPNSAAAWSRDTIPISETAMATATITTGVNNRMLVIHGSIVDNDFAGGEELFSIRPTVNGRRVTLPTDGAWLRELPPGQGISAPVGTASVTWFVDLDAVGLANVPLTIRLLASAYYPNNVANVAFSAYTVAK